MKLLPKVTVTKLSEDWRLYKFLKDRAIIDVIKQFPGVQWRPELTGWVAPCDLNGHIDDALRGIAHVDREIVLTRQAFLKPTEENKKLHDYQKEGATRILAAETGYILNFAPGLGKTPTTISALRQRFPDGNILIVCPASVRETWRKELEKWWPGHPELLVVKKSTEIGFAPIVVTSYQLFHKFSARKYAAIVFDELHYLKEGRAKRTKLAFDLRASNPDALVIGLTGTPITNEPKDLWAQLETVYPQRFGKTFWSFVHRYCNVEETEHGLDVYGIKNELELQRRLAVVAYRVTRDEVAHLLVQSMPPSTRYVRPTKKVQSIDQLLETSYDDLMAQSAPQKVTVAAEIVQEAFDNDSKHVCVLTHLHQTTHDIANKLRQEGHRNVFEITGLTENRDEVLLEASLHPTSIVVATMHSVGIGTNMLTYVDTAIFAELYWTPGKVQQAVDRFNRASSTHPTHVMFIVLEGTREEAVANTLRKRAENINLAVPSSINATPQKEEKSDDDFINELNTILARAV